MATRSQEPPAAPKPAPKGRTSKSAIKETPPTTKSAPKSKTSKPAVAAAPSSVKSATSSKTNKTETSDTPKDAPKARAPKEVSPAVAAPAAIRAKPVAPPDEPATPAPAAEAKTALPEELRAQWIAQAAYFIAERRGFSGGSAEEDWREAEMEIDRMLAATRH